MAKEFKFECNGCGIMSCATTITAADDVVSMSEPMTCLVTASEDQCDWKPIKIYGVVYD